MTDKEIELSLRVMEEQANSKIDRLDSKLDRFQSDLDHYKESHLSEHDHNENEINLKLDLINERISVLQEKYTVFMQEENNNKTRILSIKQIQLAGWGIFITILFFLVSNFFDIKYESVKKYFSSSNDINITKEQREK